jgi:hypothetical protein
MSTILPTLRYLIACEDILVDPTNPRKVSLVNLLSSIRSLEQPPFPLLYRELCVFVQLTECRGSADVALTIAHADSGVLAYSGPARPWRAKLPSDPLEVVGLPFRIRDIAFAEAGLYWLQFWYNGKVLSQQPLVLR